MVNFIIKYQENQKTLPKKTFLKIIIKMIQMIQMIQKKNMNFHIFLIKRKNNKKKKN